MNMKYDDVKLNELRDLTLMYTFIPFLKVGSIITGANFYKGEVYIIDEYRNVHTVYADKKKY